MRPSGHLRVRGDQRAGARGLRRDQRARRDRRARAAARPRPAREHARGAAGERRGVRSHVFKKIKPKSLQIFSRQFATMIEAGLNVVSALVILEEQTDDKYLGPGHRGDPRRRRGRLAALAGARAAPEGLLAALRVDGRGRRGGGHPRPGARPRRLPDREGDADQAARQGRDDLPDDGPDLRDPRPDRDADVPRPGLRQDLRPARRRAADADAVGREGVEPPPRQVVHHHPGDDRPSSASGAGSGPSRAASSGTGSSSGSR